MYFTVTKSEKYNLIWKASQVLFTNGTVLTLRES